MNVDENVAVDENLTTTDFQNDSEFAPVASKPTHLYTFRDGEKYGYLAAVSEEDQKRGKAAGDIVLFIYRGKEGNTYKIDTVAADGSVKMRAECKRPCAAIKEYTYSGVDYVGFTPDSLIGAAFTDAFNGFLQSAPLPKPQDTPQASYYEPDPVIPQASEPAASPSENDENEF